MMLEVYTDGCCLRNPGGRGGWGFVVYRDGTEIHSEHGGHSATTNNRMELRGAIEALRWLAANADGERARVFSDSTYVCDGANDWRHGWKRKQWRRGRGEVPNADLWRALDAALTDFPVRFEWVRGHSGNCGNDRADRLALLGSEKPIRRAA